MKKITYILLVVIAIGLLGVIVFYKYKNNDPEVLVNQEQNMQKSDPKILFDETNGEIPAGSMAEYEFGVFPDDTFELTFSSDHPVRIRILNHDEYSKWELSQKSTSVYSVDNAEHVAVTKDIPAGAYHLVIISGEEVDTAFSLTFKLKNGPKE